MGKPAYLDSMLFFKIFLIVIKYTWASLIAQMVQNLSVIWETCVWILDWEDPLEEDMATHLFLLENPQGQRSLVGYSPWGQKEADTTKWLSTAYKDIFFLMWIIFQIFIEFVPLLVLCFSVLAMRHVKSQLLDQGLNMHPLYLKAKS